MNSRTGIRELRKAITKWRGLDDETSLISQDIFEFAAFIGHPHNPHAKHNMIVDLSDPEVIRKIDLINGENGFLILRVMEIRNENK